MGSSQLPDLPPYLLDALEGVFAAAESSQMSHAEIVATGRLFSPRSKEPMKTRESVKMIVHRARRQLDEVLNGE